LCHSTAAAFADTRGPEVLTPENHTRTKREFRPVPPQFGGRVVDLIEKRISR
jgi:hypothetical protein